MNSFPKKIVFQISAVENDDLSIFPSAMNVTAKMKIKHFQFKKYIVEHLLSLQERLQKYFSSISTNGIEWVISPFGEHNINIASDLTYAGKKS
jgi:hypothetical protein